MYLLCKCLELGLRSANMSLSFCFMKACFPILNSREKNRHVEVKSSDNCRLWMFKIKEQLSADNFEGLISDPQY